MYQAEPNGDVAASIVTCDSTSAAKYVLLRSKIWNELKRFEIEKYLYGWNQYYVSL